MATGILACGQGGGVLIQGPLLQAIIDAFGWRTVFQIMAGVIPVLCLSGPTYSPNVQSSEPESPPEEAKSKGCHIDITVWKEPKFVSVVVSQAVILFGHFVPQVHFVNNS